MRGKKTRNMDSFIFVIHCRIEIYIFHNRINFKLKMMILFMILKQTWTQFSLFFHCGCLGSVLASGADWSVILLCLIIKAFIFIIIILLSRSCFTELSWWRWRWLELELQFLLRRQSELPECLCPCSGPHTFYLCSRWSESMHTCKARDRLLLHNEVTWGTSDWIKLSGPHWNTCWRFWQEWRVQITDVHFTTLTEWVTYIVNGQSKDEQLC